MGKREVPARETASLPPRGHYSPSTDGLQELESAPQWLGKIVRSPEEGTRFERRDEILEFYFLELWYQYSHQRGGEKDP
jgi:hypothetical protein